MSIQQVLTGQTKQVGDMVVQRLLPSGERQAVGPFLFMDHFGPMVAGLDTDADVRPHPHVGLAAVTYLFQGALQHRDSQGHVQRIEPGDLNWMVAGRGIVHSERVPDDLRGVEHVRHGLQLWAALPKEQEDCPPAFVHAVAASLPSLEVDGVQVRVMLGAAFGQVSPVEAFGGAVYLDVQMPAGLRLCLPTLAPEMALYALDGPVMVDGDPLTPLQLGLLGSPCGQASDATGGQVAAHVIEAAQATRLMVIGGVPLDAPRYMWWNFVSSRKDTIARAAQDWSGHVFGYVVDETEMTPLPERRGAADRRQTLRAAERRSKTASIARTSSGK